MKTITIYELLGMVKDGEEPNTILYENETYWYGKVEKDYYKMIAKDLDDEDVEYLFEYSVGEKLNDEVEILEEEKKIPTLNDIRENYGLPRIEEKKIPEKLPTKTPFDDKEKEDFIFKNRLKINEIIDYLKSKGE